MSLLLVGSELMLVRFHRGSRTKDEDLNITRKLILRLNDGQVIDRICLGTCRHTPGTALEFAALCHVSTVRLNP